MKNRPLSQLAFASLFAFSAPLLSRAAENAAPAPAKSAAKSFELSWTTGRTPEIEEAFRMASVLRKRFTPTHPEVLAQEERIQQLVETAPWLVTIKSSGGPLSALLVETSRDNDHSLSVINAGQPGDLDTPLPPFELRNANWGSVLGVLGNLLEARGLSLKLAGSDTPNPSDSKNVVCVLRRNGPPPEAKGPPPTTFESFQLSEFIDSKQTVDVIVDAIRSAWALDPSHDPATLQVKFHPQTKLLFVSGPGSAITIARQVIAGLRKKLL